jgi:arylsulfatase A-like enzyme
LREEGIYNNTIIIFTSDHGEELGEHGKMAWHAHTLYDELLKVPLIIKFRDSMYSGEVMEQTRSLDIAPTLLSILDLEIPEGFEGVVLDFDNGELHAVSQMDVRGKIPITSLRTGGWKLYKDRLFDLEENPEETRDYSRQYPEVKEDLMGILAELLDLERLLSAEDVDLDPQTLQQLRILGYHDLVDNTFIDNESSGKGGLVNNSK